MVACILSAEFQRLREEMQRYLPEHHKTVLHVQCPSKVFCCCRHHCACVRACGPKHWDWNIEYDLFVGYGKQKQFQFVFHQMQAHL